MSDIVERLRRLYVQNGTNYVQEAADEIERLRADAERYRWLRENLGKWRIEAYQTPVQSMVELHILGDSFFYNGDDLDRIIDGQRRDAAM